jgi:hypothetical protein
MGQRTDKRVNEKIKELTRQGVYTSSEMARHLNTFISELFPKDQLPAMTNTRFYPTTNNIKNHIQIAIRLQQ